MTGLMLRFCEPCGRAFPVVVRECPDCGEERGTYDAGKLIEKLAARPKPEKDEQLAMAAADG